MNMHNIRISENLKKLKYKDLLIFLIPVIVFFYYLHVYDPGILGSDSFYQMHQIATSNFNNWHPFFHTFIEMLCIKVYPNPVSICVFQILVFSTLWTIICKYNRDENETSNKQFYLQVLVTLIITLIPINAIFSITLFKDILFSYFIMFLCFLIKVLVDKKGYVSYKFIIVLSIIMACTSQLRPNGMFIILIMLIILGIYLFKNNTTDRLYALLPILTIIFILLIASLNVAYDVEDNQKDAVFTKVAHILAYYDWNLNLDDVGREKIYAMMDEKSIQENFKMTFSDPIYQVANHKVYENNKGTYIGLAISYSLTHPREFIEYLFNSAPMVWDITRDDTWIGNILTTSTEGGRVGFLRNGEVPVASYDNVTSTNKGTFEYNALDSFVEFTKNNDVLKTIFYSPALYMYLSIILLVVLQTMTHSRDIYLVYLPNLLNIIVIFLSTPVQDYRYLYANLLVFYLLVIILIKYKFSENPNVFSTNKNNSNYFYQTYHKPTKNRYDLPKPKHKKNWDK